MIVILIYDGVIFCKLIFDKYFLGINYSSEPLAGWVMTRWRIWLDNFFSLLIWTSTTQNQENVSIYSILIELSNSSEEFRKYVYLPWFLRWLLHFWFSYEKVTFWWSFLRMFDDLTLRTVTWNINSALDYLRYQDRLWMIIIRSNDWQDPNVAGK